jgi:hypothetical protein
MQTISYKIVYGNIIGKGVNLYNNGIQHQLISKEILEMQELRIRWAGHVRHIGERRNVYRIFAGISKGVENLVDLSIDGRLVSKLLLEK